MQKVKRDKNKHIRKKRKKEKKGKKERNPVTCQCKRLRPSVRSLCILATTREAKAYPPHLPLHKISGPLPASFRGASATPPHLTPLLASSPLLHLLFSPRGGGIAGRRIVSGWPRTRSASTRCSSPPPPRARLRSRRGPVVVPAGSTAATLSPSSGAPPPPPRRSRYDLPPARALALPALLMCTCVLWTRRGVGGIFQFCRRCAAPGSRLGVVLLCAIVALIMIPRDDFEYWWWFLQSSGDGKAISVFFLGLIKRRHQRYFGDGYCGFWVVVDPDFGLRFMFLSRPVIAHSCCLCAPLGFIYVITHPFWWPLDMAVDAVIHVIMCFQCAESPFCLIWVP